MGRNIPIAEVKVTQIICNVTEYAASAVKSVDTAFVLVVEYFNSGLMSFEPLIEKWIVSVILKVGKRSLGCH